MKKYIYILSVLLLVSSCKSKKNFSKKKTDAHIENNITQTDTQTTSNDIFKKGIIVIEEIQKGGRTSPTILSEKNRPKTETGEFKEFSEKFKDKGLTTTVNYKKDGSVNVESQSEDLQKKTTHNYEDKIKTQQDQFTKLKDKSTADIIVKDKKKDKEVEAKSSAILFVVLGIVAIIGIALFLLYKYIKSQTALIPKL